MHGVLNIDENKKLVTQFPCKSQDESFKPDNVCQIKIKVLQYQNLKTLGN